MPFKDYAGTKFVPYLLPIIPATAKLSPTRDTKLTPDKLGKIPGKRHSDGWSGFHKWQEQVTTERDLSGYASMYAAEGVLETIGIQARKFPGLDLDLSSRPIVEAIRDIAFEEMGETISRGRANSARVLLMYRAAEGEPMHKVRHTYENAAGDQEAIEFLANGQQYLIEGMHKSGVPYSWGMIDPIAYEDSLPVVGPEQVEKFFARADAAMSLVGWTRTKGAGNDRAAYSLGSNLPRIPIGPDHPDICPDPGLLEDVLTNYIPVDCPAFSTYDAWSTACCAIKTAMGGDERQYPTFQRWSDANPENVDHTRDKWESFNESGLGWSYLAGMAADYGYTKYASELFGELPDEPGAPAQQAGPAGPTRKGTTEQALGEKFVELYARKKWIHIPAKAGGHWRRCDNGIWVEGFTAPHDAGRVCAAASDAIRASGNASPVDLARADALMTAHSQNAVLSIAKSHPSCSVKYVMLDSTPLIMGVPGGFVDEEGKLRDPDPGMLLSRMAGVRPDFDALCPEFDNLVLSLANFDKDVEECLWGLIGYTARGLGDQQKFPFLHGKGNEGKTTFFTILGKVFGDYGKTFKPEIFMRGVDNRFAMAPFDGAWFIYGSEIAKGAKWNDSAVKMATGGGQTPIEKKYLDAFEMWIRFMPWFSGNNLPHFAGNDLALKRRMMLFQCMTRIAEVVASWDLKVFRAEGPAILGKAVRYRQAYLKRGLWIAPQVQAWTDDYFDQNDITGQFIDDCLIADKDAPLITKQSVYDRFQEYARTSHGHEFILHRDRFCEELEEHPKLLAMGGMCVRRRLGGRNTNPQHCVSGIRIESA